MSGSKACSRSVNKTNGNRKLSQSSSKNKSKELTEKEVVAEK